MSGFGTRPTAAPVPVAANRQALIDALMGVPARVGSAFTNMAQQGLAANERFMQGEGADQAFLPSMDSGGRVGALASFLASNMALGGPAGSLGAGPSVYRGYHASPNDFAAFDLAKAGSTTDSGKLGRALYFGTDPRVAERGPFRYEAEIKSASPLELELPSFKTDKADVVRSALGLPLDATSDAVSSAAKSRGHDAIVLDYTPTGYAHKEVAALDGSIVSILRKYGLAGLLAGGYAAQPQE